MIVPSPGSAGAIAIAGYPQLLAASAVAVSCPVDTTEDILATINIPAGAMGLNGILRTDFISTFTNSANNKVLRIRLGGIGGTVMMQQTLTTTAGWHEHNLIRNRGVANSQIVWGVGNAAFGSASSPTTTAAIDTSAATTLVITGQKALNSETLTLESYLVELFYKA